MASITERAIKLAGQGPWARSRRFARALAPATRNDLIRIGSSYGGWTIPEAALSADSVCYCAGVGLDISFDLGLIQRFGCTVEAFDPTPSAAAHAASAAADEPGFRFHPVGIWSEDSELEFHQPDYGDQNYSAVNLHGTDPGFTAQCRTVRSLMAELGHDRIDLLKLDIEGAEFQVVESITNDRLPIGILCVEFHRNGGLSGMKAAAATLKANGFVPVHIEGDDTTFVHSSR